jgi:hypothetical protein
MTEMVETEYDWKKEIQVCKGHLFPDEPSKTKEWLDLSSTKFPEDSDLVKPKLTLATQHLEI